MRVLLTGATGTIGGSVLNCLLEGGHEVTCPVRSLSKVSNLNSNPRVHYVEVDSSLDDYSKYNQVAQGFPCIIHTGFSNTGRDAEFETTVLRGLLEAAKVHSVNEKVSFTFTTGSHVIGSTDHFVNDDEVSSENSEPFCRWRAVLENLVLSYSSENFAASIVRPCWVYGDSFVDNWFSASKSDGKIVVPENYGKVSFIYKDDLAMIYRLIIENHARGCFVGSEGQGPEIDEIIELNKRLTGVTLVEKVQDIWSLVHDFKYGFLIGLAHKCSVDSKRAKTELGFVPRYNFIRDAERVLRIN